jgi:hemerythrin-like domain-containing protein
MMSYIVEVLRQEHRNIETLLRVLERELSLFDRGDRPDYDVILAIIDYFRDYPDSCHHPKEDMIIERLRVRDPAGVTVVGDLEAQHREGAKRLRRVAEAVERVLNDQDLLRQDVHNIVADFIDRERQHMAMEERFLFPTALEALRPKDWRDIGKKLGNRTDPLDQPDSEEKFKKLRRSILAMEAEVEAERVAHK